MSASKRRKAEKEAQRKAKQSAKRHRSGGLQRRRTKPTRLQRKRILIVCEGAVTEVRYFQAFVVRATVEVKVDGLGDNTLSLVERAVEMHQDGKFDETWIVFDRDSFPAERFRAAIDLARRSRLSVAYTNEAFEAWYLMHFDYCDAALSRDTYRQRLTGKLGRAYEKNDPRMYAELAPRQATAIANATRLLTFYGDAHDPERDNPSTTVHLLVERLNGLAS